MSEKVRVRFAPSPTGYLHIGGARTALFNWLFARHKKGQFILRIEDTDRERAQPKALDSIIGGLKWLGLDWDEGPFYQSKFIEKHRHFAQVLVEKGKARRIPGKEGGDAVEFLMPPGETRFDDLVHGKIKIDNQELGNFVILRGDQTPTYNLACVVDDAFLSITDVIRGDDHVSNTPKQIALYQALDFSLPRFAHLPLILGADGSRLSKRHGATALDFYQEKGYLPEAVLNYLALLGWSPKDNREKVSVGEIIEKFSLEGVGKKGAIFDSEKLNWMNGTYLAEGNSEKMLEIAAQYLKSIGYIKDEVNPEWLKKVLNLFKTRIKYIAQLKEQADFLFLDEIKIDAGAEEKFLKRDYIPGMFKQLRERLGELEVFEAGEIEEICRGLAKELGVKSGDLIHPARVAVTGRAVSPGLFETMAVMGKEKCVKRLEKQII
ncbi:MAG: glutamate--tRNA ligase [Candidatus Ratteibacteria bacterium]|nr:glutamate--tRNA ligase [Candidatus Ratteibacteria bacterium]